MRGVASLAFALGACAQERVTAATATERIVSDSSAIITDAPVYWLTDIGGTLLARVHATYANHSSERVYFSRCNTNDTGPYYWIRRTGTDSLKPADVGPVWGCPAGVPYGVVEPGGTLSFDVIPSARADYNGSPPPNPAARVGLFRGEVGFWRCPWIGSSSQCTLLPQVERQTNTFELRY